MSKPVVYVAGPFRGDSHWKIAENIRRAERAALELWKIGAAALCPHANTSNFQDELPDHVWLDGDFELLRRCDAVLMIKGWRQSVGACAEYSFAEQEGVLVLNDLDDAIEFVGDWYQGTGQEMPELFARYAEKVYKGGHGRSRTPQIGQG